MKRKFLLFLTVCLMCLIFAGCERNHDMVCVYNRDELVYDDINIELPDGYFYENHEKFKVDEKTVGITIYFSKEEDAGWDYKEEVTE